MQKEYQIVYDYKGHQISTMNGSDDWIPTKEIAEKLLERRQQKPFFMGEKLYLVERNNPTPYPAMQAYNGKPVYEYPYLYWDALDVGDYVSAEVAEWIAECVPPIMYSKGLIQCGEPYDSALDKTINCHRPVYLTLRHVGDGVWEFIGYCFKGQTVDYRGGDFMGKPTFYEPNATYIENGEVKKLWTYDSAFTVEQAKKQISIWRDFYHYNIVRGWVDVRCGDEIIDTIEV